MNNTLLSLEKLARKQPDAELVYTLAELSWVDGLKLDRWRKAQAIDRFLDTVGYAYDYLFDPELADGRRPSDPRYRLAFDLYNAGLERIIRAAQSQDPIDPQGVIKLKVHGHEQELQVRLLDSPWTAKDIHKLILSSDFEVTGLATSRNQYGLGVPLIGVRVTDPKKEERHGQERFYPTEMAFALTAFMVPNSRLKDVGERVDDARKCTLALIDPVRQRTRRRAAQPDRARDRPDHPPGLHVVAYRPGEVPLVRPDPPRAGPGASQPADGSPLRARQDPGGDGPRADLQPAGLDSHAQRAVARPANPAEISVHALHVSDRGADSDCGGQPAQCCSARRRCCSTPTAATLPSTGWSCSGTAWAGCSPTS